MNMRKNLGAFVLAGGLALAAGGNFGAFSGIAGPAVSVEAAITKKDAYLAYSAWLSSKKSDTYKKFKLLDLDGDGVEELFGKSANEDPYGEVYSYVVLTYNGTKLAKKSFQSGVASAGGYRGGTSILPGKGKIWENYISSGTGEGEDIIYTLKNGKFKKTATGTYSLASETNQWKGKTVSAKTYSKKLEKMFPSAKAKDLEKMSYQSRSKVLAKLK